MMRACNVVILVCALALLCSCRRPKGFDGATLVEVAPGVALTNHVIGDLPLSVYVARLARSNHLFDLHSVHASNSALGLSTLTEQIQSLPPAYGTPVAGLNGDFYQRERAFAGDPRGLQIVEGEVISAPSGTSTLWVDAAGEPHLGTIQSNFRITWPNGASNPIGLNEDRRTNSPLVLFTPAIGETTKTTSNGVEYVLEAVDSSAWLPLRIGRTYNARVTSVGIKNSQVPTNGMVLSIAPSWVSRVPKLDPGAVVTLSTATAPDLTGTRTAISGGPILIRARKVQKIEPAGLFDPKSYAAKSMYEEHPRSALGWNDRYLYFVEVDGRLASSVGISLKHLAEYMADLGCTEAINLDGGGSSTLWVNGAVANLPCDGFERPIANSIIATRRTVQSAKRD